MMLNPLQPPTKLGLTIALGSLLLATGLARAQTEGLVIKRPAQLRGAPAEAAPVLASLPVQTTLTRLGDKQGPWIKVRVADGAQGWVHMFDVTAGNAQHGSGAGNAGASALRSISGFFNKSSTQAQGNTVATSTLGIRGLGAESLASAQPNGAALAQVEALRQNAAQARQFAAAAALTPRAVEHLPVPSGLTAPQTSTAEPAAFTNSDR